MIWATPASGLGSRQGPGVAALSFALEMAGLLQSGCPVPLPLTVGEVAAIIIGRPSETERGDDQSERLQGRSMVQIRWDEGGTSRASKTVPPP
jgi:hypothetical protein